LNGTVEVAKDFSSSNLPAPGAGLKNYAQCCQPSCDNVCGDAQVERDEELTILQVLDSAQLAGAMGLGATGAASVVGLGVAGAVVGMAADAAARVASLGAQMADGGAAPGADTSVEDEARRARTLDLAAAKSAQARLVKNLRRGGYKHIAEKAAGCGTRPLPRRMTVDVKGGEDDRRHLSGLCHCKSMLCPLCAPYYGAKRAEKLAAQIPAVLATGGHIFHMVMTLRHHKGAKYRTLVDALRATRRKMLQQRFWKEAVLGNVRTTENTYGLHGHHPHDHSLPVLRPEVNAEEFAAKVQAFWERELKKLGRSCDWKEGWFTPVKAENVEQLICYLNKAIDEVTGGGNKTKAVWTLPVSAYAEIFETGRGLKWFSVSGCWKSVETEAAESEDSLEAERETADPILYSIPVPIWNSWTVEDRLLIRALIYDRSVSNERCVELLSHICSEIALE
jgi:hypothetical protein